jgi:hypothetical protein
MEGKQYNSSFFIQGLLIGGLAGAFVLYISLVIVNLYPVGAQTPIERPVQKNKDTGSSEVLKNEVEYKERISASLALTQDEFRKLYEEILSYHHFLDYMKIFLPISLLLLVTLGGTLGSHFVKANVYEAKEAMKRDLKEDLKEKTEEAQKALLIAEASYTKSVEGLIELRKEVETRIKLKIDHALISINYALATNFWRNGLVSNSIVYGERALSCLDSILPALTDNERMRLETHKVNLLGDLAYYHAELYRQRKNDENATRALELARMIVVKLDCLTTHVEKMAQIDNFLFAMSQVELLTHDDKQAWKKTFRNYREPLKAFLKQEVSNGEKVLESYDTFLGKMERV